MPPRSWVLASAGLLVNICRTLGNELPANISSSTIGGNRGFVRLGSPNAVWGGDAGSIGATFNLGFDVPRAVEIATSVTLAPSLLKPPRRELKVPRAAGIVHAQAPDRDAKASMAAGIPRTPGLPPTWVTEIDSLLGIRRVVPTGMAAVSGTEAAHKDCASGGSASRGFKSNLGGVRVDSNQRFGGAAQVQQVIRDGKTAQTVTIARVGVATEPAPGPRPHSKAVGFGQLTPQAGLRVQRGPDWRWGDQDGGEGSVGIVVDAGHDGWCSVRWPTGHVNGYRVGHSGLFDLLAAGPGTPQGHHKGQRSSSVAQSTVSDRSQQHAGAAGAGQLGVQPGLKVQRGPDWQWGEQDGGWGSVGVVMDVTRDGWCTVRWPSGHVNGYRMGNGGRFDLVLAGAGGAAWHRQVERRPSAAVQAAAQLGARSGVRRGAVAVGRQHRGKTRCWCVDQYGDVLELP